MQECLFSDFAELLPGLIDIMRNLGFDGNQSQADSLTARVSFEWSGSTLQLRAGPSIAWTGVCGVCASALH